MSKTRNPKSFSARAMLSLSPLLPPLLSLAIVAIVPANHAKIIDALRNTPVVGALI